MATDKQVLTLRNALEGLLAHPMGSRADASVREAHEALRQVEMCLWCDVRTARRNNLYCSRECDTLRWVATGEKN